jgi:hypothetical protein
MGVLVAVAAGTEIARNLTEMADKLRDNFPARLVVVEMRNEPDHTLVLTGHEHTSGTFGELPSTRIPPHTVDIYGSRRRGRPEGAAGSVTYRIEGKQAQLTVGWRLRWRSWRSRSSTSALSGRQAHEFGLTDLIGGSTTSGIARFELTEQVEAIIVDGSPAAGGRRTERPRQGIGGRPQQR